MEEGKQQDRHVTKTGGLVVLDQLTDQLWWCVLDIILRNHRIVLPVLCEQSQVPLKSTLSFSVGDLNLNVSGTEMYFLLPAGGVVLYRQWLSPGVFCWRSCLPPWSCRTAPSPEPLTARGDRRRPQQVAATPCSTLCRASRATATAGSVEVRVPVAPKEEPGCSPTGPCTPWPGLRTMGWAWRVWARWDWRWARAGTETDLEWVWKVHSRPETTTFWGHAKGGDTDTGTGTDTTSSTGDKGVGTKRDGTEKVSPVTQTLKIKAIGLNHYPLQFVPSNKELNGYFTEEL